MRDAERLLRAETFDLILIDIALPDGNGLILVDQIPVLTGHPVPVIILSVAEVPADVQGKVVAVLVKAQVSTARIASTILRYLPSAPPGVRFL
jgi:DNA-binding response OmpR family regulator